MAHAAKQCACCGSTEGVEEHHLYPRMYGCPDDLTVWLCHTCHGRVHGQQNRVNLSDMAKAMWQRPEFRENAVRMAKEIWKHPEFRNKAAETAKAIWQQGRFREKLLRALRSKYPRP